MIAFDDVEAWEAQVAADPNSAFAREHLLGALTGNPTRNERRRIEIIEWLVDHDPGNTVCATPYFYVDFQRFPEEYGRIKQKWLDLVASVSPPEPVLVQGAANFIASTDLVEANVLLRNAVQSHPNDAKLWFDVARTSKDPADRLFALEKAASIRDEADHLLVWIGMAALKAGANDKAKVAGRALLGIVADIEARFHDKLEWNKLEDEFWGKASDAGLSHEEAKELSMALADHAHRKHWGHTILGLLACRENSFEEAADHLRVSADVHPDFRLSAYGPSLSLLRELCRRGYWEDGLQFLNRWKAIWDDPRVDEWVIAVRNERLPASKGD